MKTKYCYFPILKTTDAELKAYSYLDESVKNEILPIFELTRSRRSKTNPTADISKRIDKISEFVGKRRFILDLTTEITLSNAQISDMLNTPQNGYKMWVSFVRELQEQSLNVIPMIHFNPYEIKEVEKEIKTLQGLSSNVAFRVSLEDSDTLSYIERIAAIYDISRLILILDGGYIDLASDGSSGDRSNRFSIMLDQIRMEKMIPKAIICAFSSFPSAVGKMPWGNYNNGRFPISEVITHAELRKKDKTILHGDYGSVHPFRYETAGGSWVPRVDFMTDDTFYYHRYRREDGGYVRAATEVLEDSNYRKIRDLDVWGDQEIEAAANDAPRGLNPSHWIAVRINTYVTKQYLRLREKSYMSL